MDITILGIESSCDDTSAAVIRDRTLLSNVIASQAVHMKYGGVIPELASRAHQQNLVPVVDTALKEAGVAPDELDAIAFGYTRLLEESNGVLQDLRQVINVSTLSMTDKDRMDVVDNCYYEMRRYRNLVSYYTNKNIAVSYLRARKKNDMERVMRLYGNETSKYW